MEKNSPVSVAHMTSDVLGMHDDWDLTDALRGGTKTMRQQGERYLPRRKREDEEDYEKRLGVSTLFPAYGETVKRLTGRVFSKPLLVDEKTFPSWIKDEVLDDVDREGARLEVFAQAFFELALHRGHAFILVDAPRIDKANVRTVEDARKVGARPYLVLIDPRRVLGWYEENGRLLEVRISFDVKERDSYGFRITKEIRVYRPGSVQVFRSENGGAYVEADSYEVDLEDIPLVVLYTQKTGFFTSEPPLRELAYLNAKHWRLQSGSDALVETACVPILALIGVDANDEVIIGAKSALRLPKDGDAKYVEHTGKAIETAHASLSKLEREMEQAGAKLLQRDTQGNKTATEAGEDSARENSKLGRMTQALDDALAAVLYYVAAWRGETNVIANVTSQPNLERLPNTEGAMRSVLEMYRDGIIDASLVFRTAQRLGLVNEDEDFETVYNRIRESQPTGPGMDIGGEE